MACVLQWHLPAVLAHKVPLWVMTHGHRSIAAVCLAQRFWDGSPNLSLGNSSGQSLMLGPGGGGPPFSCRASLPPAGFGFP